MHRALRLRSNADFQRIRRVGKSVANPWLVLVQAPNAEGQTRFGFVVGKKLGGAVERNKIKRRLRERLRLYWQAERLRAGMDVVVIARVPAGKADARTLAEALDDVVGRAGLWRRQG